MIDSSLLCSVLMWIGLPRYVVILPDSAVYPSTWLGARWGLTGPHQVWHVNLSLFWPFMEITVIPRWASTFWGIKRKKIENWKWSSSVFDTVTFLKRSSKVQQCFKSLFKVLKELSQKAITHGDERGYQHTHTFRAFFTLKSGHNLHRKRLLWLHIFSSHYMYLTISVRPKIPTTVFEITFVTPQQNAGNSVRSYSNAVRELTGCPILLYWLWLLKCAVNIKEWLYKCVCAHLRLP